MKNWKRFIPDLKTRLAPNQRQLFLLGGLTFLLLLISPVSITKGCGSVDRSFQGYSFLYSRTIDPALPFAPFLLDFKSIRQLYKGQRVEQRNDNLKEWQDRFCGQPNLADLREVIYKSSVDQLKQLRTSMSSKSIPLGYRMRNNTFAQYLDRNKCFETVDYLLFAKRCEPYVVRPDAWGDFEKQKEAMQTLMERGKRAFMKTKSHYFRLRYAYQVIRLAHYAKDYEQVLEFYDFFMPKTDNAPSIIEYWILGHKAGALMGLGRNVEASYLFSQVFEYCHSKRESAFRSFKIKTDEEWKACLLLCKDDHERATLYVLRAHNRDAKIVEELENIYALEPQNENIELLVTREIQKLEKDLLGYEFNDKKRHNRRYHNIPRPFAGEYIIELQDFVRKVLEERLVKNLGFWKITEGYLELLAGNHYQAERSFKEARLIVKNEQLKEQLEIFELALQISSYEEVTDKVERALVTIQNDNKWYKGIKSFSDFMGDKFARLYAQENHPGKAFRSHYELKDLKSNPQMDVIDDLLIVCEKEFTNRYERKMIEQGDSTIKNDLLDIKATMLFSQFQLEAALETYKKMNRVDWDHYGIFSPFQERFNDRIRYLIPGGATFYNKGELFEELLKLDYEARSEPDRDKAALLFYKLGNAYYNITYFGYSWKAMDYFRSSTSMSPYLLEEGDHVFPHIHCVQGNREYFDCSKALEYYELARRSAIDPEITAKATFMAAKCEQNKFFVEGPSGGQRTYEYFDILVNNYMDTKFGQTLGKRCKYFQAYVDRYYGD